MDWCVGHRLLVGIRIVSEDEPSGCAASGLWEDKVCCVGFHGEDHVAGVETEDSIWVGMEVIHEHGCFCVGVLGGVCLCRGDFVESRFDAWVYFGIVEEGAGDGLDAAFAFGVEGSCFCLDSGFLRLF